MYQAFFRFIGLIVPIMTTRWLAVCHAIVVGAFFSVINPVDCMGLMKGTRLLLELREGDRATQGLTFVDQQSRLESLWFHSPPDRYDSEFSVELDTIHEH